MDDRELVQRCIAKDERAWRELVRRYHGVLRGMAAKEWMRRVGPPAEDRLDEICARVYEKLLEGDCRILKTFRWECSLRSWLAGLAYLTARWHCREASRERGSQADVSGEAGDPVPDSLELEEDRLVVRRFLDLLPPEDRELLQARFWEERPYEEIARETGEQPNALMVRVARLKKMLSNQLRGFFSILL